MAERDLKKLMSEKARATRDNEHTGSQSAVTPAIESVLGNQAVQAMMSVKPTSRSVSGFIQAKLTVNAPDDAYEAEADAVAKSALSAFQNTPSVQREGVEDELMAKPIQREGDEDELMAKPIQREGDEDELMAKPIQREGDEDELMAKPIQREGDEDELMAKPIQREGDGSFDVDSGVENEIEAQRGGGSPLPETTQSRFEGALGYDFSSVRVHTGSQSDRLSREVSARAFTTGSDIFFGEGEYKPETSDGQELLGHELTHVVQQGHARPKDQQGE
jgi:hypothetical protein